MLLSHEKDLIRERLLNLAKTDTAITGAALTGSHAAGQGDEWSDIDLVLAVRGDLTAAVDSWSRRLYDEFSALHHWDLATPPSTIRVFLLPDWLEIDLTFSPETDFAPRGPQWHTVFGQTADLKPFATPEPETLIGLSWHHALHARTGIERNRQWQAEHWISAIRDHLITLACLRMGHPTAYAKGAHLLPNELTAPLEETLVRSLTDHELRRALKATVDLLTAEIELWNTALADRLRPALTQLTGTERA
jgi:predicted nucleotidyltransferase